MLFLTEDFKEALGGCNIILFDTSCITDPDSAFRKEWDECIYSYLTEQEQEWSDKLVKAWTNFAYYGQEIGLILFFLNFIIFFFGLALQHQKIKLNCQF